METLAPVSVARIVRGPTAARFRMAVLCYIALFMALEGYDTQIMGYAAPAIIKAMHSTKSEFGVVFGVLQIGFLAGAISVGTLGDRIGRKAVITGAAFALAVCTVCCAFATGLYELIAIRAVTGIAIGAAIPNSIALIAEYAPEKKEATWVGISYVGYSIGNIAGGLIAAAMIPKYGWSSVFLLGGFAPLVVALFFIFVLPESARYLAVEGRHKAKLVALLQRIDPTCDFTLEAYFEYSSEARAGKASIKRLFSEGRAPRTLMLWAALATAFIASHFLSSWLPTVIEGTGLSLQYAAVTTSVFMVGGFVGSYLVGYMLDKFGAKALVLNYTIAVPAVAALGWVGHSSALLFVLVLIVGIVTIGGQVAVYGFAGTIYPTSIRSTGVGWGLGVGRFGSVLGPVLGGVLLSRDFSLPALYGCAAAPMLITIVALFWVGRKPLEHA